MPAPDTELVRQMWEEFADALPPANPTAWNVVTERWWHPDLVYDEDPRWPGSGSHHGRDQVRAAFEGYAELLGTATFQVERIVTGDHGIVGLVRVRGDSSAGVPWDHLWGYLCRTRDGQLAYLRAYWDPDEALRDAGAS